MAVHRMTTCRTMQKYRIEGLSDLVFGLALSIGSLAMISQPVNDINDIRDGVLQFVFSFLIIVNVWVSYTNIISEIKVETEMDFRLNLALLMLVAIEPYLLFLLGHDDREIQDWSSTAYAIDIGLIMLILAGLYHRRARPDSSADSTKQYSMARNRYLGTAFIFLISALPIFWLQGIVFNINLRYLIWMLAIVPAVAIRLMRYRAKGTDGQR
jgi:uncharacterized membrane protein